MSLNVMNKLGYHVNDWVDSGVLTVRTQRNGSILKVLHPNFAELEGWKSRNPNGIVVYRQHFGDTNMRTWQEKCDVAIDYVKRQHCEELVDVIEVPYNECFQNRHDRIHEFADVNIKCADYIRSKLPGVKVAGGNFSVGNPPDMFDDWAPFVKALGHLDYLSLHEYAWPHVHSEPHDVQGSNRETRQGKKTGYWVFRYRYVYDWLQRSNYPQPPLILSEFGRDRGCVGEGLAGWKVGVGDVRQYADELRWAAQEMNKDSYLVGATIYCCGVIDKFWKSFDVSGESVIEDLLNEQWPAEPVVNIPPVPVHTKKVEKPVEVLQAARAQASEYSQWRNDPRNEWPVGTELELSEFRKHAARNDAIQGKGNREAIGVNEAITRGYPAKYVQANDKPDANAMARNFGIPSSRIRSILKIESGETAFDPDTKYPLVRLELHILMNSLNAQERAVAANHFRFKPGVRQWSAGAQEFLDPGDRTWKVLEYGGQFLRLAAISAAYNMFGDRAMQATSIGIGQIMGFHYRRLGFKSAQEMFEFAAVSEENQVEMMAKFIQSDQRLLSSIKSGDAEGFAMAWNGSGQYHYFANLLRQNGW